MQIQVQVHTPTLCGINYVNKNCVPAKPSLNFCKQRRGQRDWPTLRARLVPPVVPRSPLDAVSSKRLYHLTNRSQLHPIWPLTVFAQKSNVVHGSWLWKRLSCLLWHMAAANVAAEQRVGDFPWTWGSKNPESLHGITMVDRDIFQVGSHPGCHVRDCVMRACKGRNAAISRVPVMNEWMEYDESPLGEKKLLTNQRPRTASEMKTRKFPMDFVSFQYREPQQPQATGQYSVVIV